MIIKTTNHQIQDLRKQLSIANSKLAQEKEEHKSCGDRLASLRMELSIRDALIKKQRDENTFLQKALLRAIENQDVTVEDLREQIEELESKLDDAQAEKLAGAALTADVALTAPAVTWLLLKVCDKVHPMVGLAAESFICYQLIAARSLRDESMAVHDRLAAGDLQGRGVLDLGQGDALGRGLGLGHELVDQICHGWLLLV